jgi:ribonuclease BN (tRNA processing enzyme)
MEERMRFLPAILATAIAVSPVLASPSQAETTFITLGTEGGPIAAPNRGQPSNLLIVNGVNTLIDCGDGTIQRLSKLNLRAMSIDNLVLTHLHFDHVGGLLAVLGLRFATNSPHPLQIYGPPGTDEMVKGLLEGMKPSMEVDYGVPGQKSFTVEQLVQIHVVKGGETFDVSGVKFTAAANTHYGFKPGSAEAEAHQSLGYRIQTPDKTIGLTGDTGPSDAITELVKGADIMVGEMMDIPLTVALIKRVDPHLDGNRLEGMKFHFSHHHLTPADLAAMAAKAGVKELVVTHLAPGGAMKPENLASYKEEIARTFHGQIVIASDMDKF